MIVEQEILRQWIKNVFNKDLYYIPMSYTIIFKHISENYGMQITIYVFNKIIENHVPFSFRIGNIPKWGNYDIFIDKIRNAKFFNYYSADIWLVNNRHSNKIGMSKVIIKYFLIYHNLIERIKIYNIKNDEKYYYIFETNLRKFNKNKEEIKLEENEKIMANQQINKFLEFREDFRNMKLVGGCFHNKYTI